MVKFFSLFLDCRARVIKIISSDSVAKISRALSSGSWFTRCAPGNVKFTFVALRRKLFYGFADVIKNTSLCTNDGHKFAKFLVSRLLHSLYFGAGARSRAHPGPLPAFEQTRSVTLSSALVGMKNGTVTRDRCDLISVEN